MAVKTKRTRYAVDLDGEGRLTADEGEPVAFGREWTPEHLMLAALARCCLSALAYHARRSALAYRGTSSASGTVAERDDGSWGFVEIECCPEAHLDPEPPAPDLRALLERAEHGCFIGASLDPAPSYRWRINGRDLPQSPEQREGSYRPR